ncbi:MAG: hypothetical protein KJ955_00790 [Nanoarchaeota archaeon]|nr:hypothetical protein [Nanoarchaeota archaeon]
MVKRITIAMLVSLVLVQAVLAANAYDLDAFSKEQPLQGIILEKDDRVNFAMLDGVHTLWLKDVSTNEQTVKMRIFRFSNEASEAEGIPFFGIDNLVKVDLDQDGNDDVSLDIEKIENGRVTLLVMSVADYEASVAEQEMPEVTGAPAEQGVVQEKKDYTKTYWAIGIAIVVLGVLLYSRAMKSGEEPEKKDKKGKKAEEE